MCPVHQTNLVLSKMNKNNELNFSDCVIIPLLAIFCGYLYLLNLDFPLGFHPDEARKVSFVIRDYHDFKHPGLMIILGKIPAFVLDANSPQEIVYAGRLTSALAFTILVIAVFYLSRQFMPTLWATAAALSTGAIPLSVVHAHYFKEDAILVMTQMLALIAFTLWNDKKTPLRLILLAFALGLVISAKYIGIITVVTILVFIWQRQTSPMSKAIRDISLYVTLPIIITFLAIFLITHDSSAQLVKGFSHELKHVINGHFGMDHGVIPLWYFNSAILPGFTPLLFVIIGSGLLFTIISWNSQTVIITLILSLCVVYSFVLCLTDVAFIRYILPVTTILPILSFWGWYTVLLKQNIIINSVFATLTVTGISIASWYSYQVVLSVNERNDARYSAQQWIKKNSGQYVRDYTYDYGIKAKRVNCRTYPELLKTADYYIAESVFYSRFSKLDREKNSCELTFQKLYDNFWKREFIEFRSSWKDQFAYFGSTVRIIPLSDKAKAVIQQKLVKKNVE